MGYLTPKIFHPLRYIFWEDTHIFKSKVSKFCIRFGGWKNFLVLIISGKKKKCKKKVAKMKKILKKSVPLHFPSGAG